MNINVEKIITKNKNETKTMVFIFYFLFLFYFILFFAFFLFFYILIIFLVFVSEDFFHFGHISTQNLLQITTQLQNSRRHKFLFG